MFTAWLRKVGPEYRGTVNAQVILLIFNRRKLAREKKYIVDRAAGSLSRRQAFLTTWPHQKAIQVESESIACSGSPSLVTKKTGIPSTPRVHQTNVSLGTKPILRPPNWRQDPAVGCEELPQSPQGWRILKILRAPFSA
jgi:hypothetical protein